MMMIKPLQYILLSTIYYYMQKFCKTNFLYLKAGSNVKCKSLIYGQNNFFNKQSGSTSIL